MGTSAKADRATPAEPVVSALRDGIPSAKEVVRQMLFLSHRSTARRLCDRLVADGFGRTLAQLGIQRAIHFGHLVICDNLDLALPNPAYVSDAPKTDRFGRPLLTIDQLAKAIEAGTGETERLDPKDESAVRKHSPSTS